MSVLQSMVHAYRYIYYLPTCVRTYVHIYLYICRYTHTLTCASDCVVLHRSVYVFFPIYLICPCLHFQLCTLLASKEDGPLRSGLLGRMQGTPTRVAGRNLEGAKTSPEDESEALDFCNLDVEHAEHCPSPGFTVCGLLGP